ncbi:MAG TPA: hypothetical protein VFK86_01410 [Bauldia sp.]|nr:hypothetical protein [Bauldia sp.]
MAIDKSEFDLALLNLAVTAHDVVSGGRRLIISADNVTVGQGRETATRSALAATSCPSASPTEIVGRVFDTFFTTTEVGKGPGRGLSPDGGLRKVTAQVVVGESVSIHAPFTLQEDTGGRQHAIRTCALARDPLIPV